MSTTTRRGATALAVLLLMAGLFVARSHHRYGTWNAFDTPQRIPALNRAYLPSGDTAVTQAELRRNLTHAPWVEVTTVRPVPGLDVAARDVYSAPRDGCASVVGLRVGEDRYLPYVLSGGC